MISENTIETFIKEMEKDQIEISRSISENAVDKDKKLKQLSKLNSLLIQLNDYKTVYKYLRLKLLRKPTKPLPW